MTKKETKVTKSTASRQAPNYAGKPVYKVISKGFTVEWTGKHSEAESAFREASTPKEWWLIQANGKDCTLLQASTH
jgi:hypothetical protein